jgi:hypothetical protein
MNCPLELHSDFLLDESVSGQWTYHKTSKKSGVVYGELMAHSREFKEIPCPDLCFDLIQVTGFPQEPFFCGRLFTELNRILEPQGKLCFNPNLRTENTCWAHTTSPANERPDFATAEETIIYYGMKSGFTFTKKETGASKRRRDSKNQCYSLHLTLTDPAAPLSPKPVSKPPGKSGQTLLWFIKEQTAATFEKEPTLES